MVGRGFEGDDGNALEALCLEHLQVRPWREKHLALALELRQPVIRIISAFSTISEKNRLAAHLDYNRNTKKRHRNAGG